MCSTKRNLEILDTLQEEIIVCTFKKKKTKKLVYTLNKIINAAIFLLQERL